MLEPISETFSGRSFTQCEIDQISEIVMTCPGLSRTELANTVCELFSWKRPSGKLKTVECRQFLEYLGSKNILCLPQRRFKRPLKTRTINTVNAQRRYNLQKIVNNSRFLIFPWVKVKNLASYVLAMAAKVVPADWLNCYGYRPVLFETLVDPCRYKGTCYQAANWIHVGTTTGRGRMDRNNQRQGMSPKQVYLYPLTALFRKELLIV
jgi:hypothetical protein